MGVEDTTKTDTRTETTDRPASQERPYTPPPDNPGSPGQPSRLESLARAREQQQSRAQETQDKDTGSPPREERDDKATTEQTGSGNEKTETSGKPKAEDQDRREDDDRPGTDQPGQRDKREQEPSSENEGTMFGREADNGTPGDGDRPQGQGAEQRADTRDEPADRPASSERRWTPPPDNPGSPGQPSRLESLAHAREEQERRSQQSEGTDTGSHPTEQRDNQPAAAQPENDGATAGAEGKPGDAGKEQDTGTPEMDEGRAEDEPKLDASQAPSTPENKPHDVDKPADDSREPAGANTGQPTEATEPAPDTGTRTDEPGDQPTTDNTPPSPEEPHQNQGTQEPLGQHDGDRDKKTKEPETTEPDNENNAPNNDSPQSGETEEPGTELAPHEPNNAEMEEPGRFQGRIRIYVDSDGRPIPPNREPGTDTADRGEIRRPEDDPVSRDYQESDPDNPSRGREALRRFLNKASDAKDATNKYSEPAQQNLERIQPTGQLCGARPNTDQIRPQDQTAKVGDGSLGVVSAAIVLTQMTRAGISLARQTRRRERADN